jgi:hypothetical protein
VLAASVAQCHAAGANAVFTVANYPVDAVAQDAVTAKERALADGQQAAFRSLLKRLVPVTAYNRIAKLRSVKAADFIDGVAVRSERNSSTQYIAALDFSFQADAVRALLRREGVPYVDSQAPPVTVVPVYLAPPAAQGAAPADLAQAKGSEAWGDVWKGLDLAHALTPVKLAALKPSVHADTVGLMREGDARGLRIITGEYGSELVLLAVAEADLAARKVHVTLAGRDAVGAFVLERSYRMQINDFAYTAELAAVVALGTLEGRWKAFKARWSPDGPYTPSAPLRPVQLLVEFRSMGQWQEIRRQIEETPGVEDMQIGGISTRGADVALRFPGGGEQLAEALRPQGLQMRNSGGTWLVRPLN